MPGTPQGGRRSAATNKARYGLEFYHLIGAEGGRKSRGGGFNDRTLAKRAGSKGGKQSVKIRRRKRELIEQATAGRDRLGGAMARDARGRFVKQDRETVRISPRWLDEPPTLVPVTPLVVVDMIVSRETDRISLELVLAAGYVTLCLVAGMLGGFLGARWGL